MVSRLRTLRGRGESYSEVILRLVNSCARAAIY